MPRPHPALVELAAGRPLPPVDNYTELLRSAGEHRMRGLLWSAQQAGQVEFPPEHTRGLARRELLAETWNRQLWRTLLEVQDRLEGIGIETAVAKGVAAEARWYDRLGERPADDVDFMIAPKDIDRIGDIIRLLDPGHETAELYARLMKKGWIQSIDLRVDPGVWVDIHSDIMKVEVNTRQLQEVWNRSVLVPAPDGERRVRALDAETSLIQLLLHLNKDRFSRLLGFVDVLRIIELEDLDWDFIDQFLSVEGFRMHAYLALEVVADELAVDFPRPEPPKGWRSRAWRTLWSKRVRLNGDIGLNRRHRRQFWMPFLAPGRAREAYGPSWRRAVPPSDLMTIHHPEGKGSYLRRLLSSRHQKAVDRRRTIKQLRQAAKE
jgi:hypothetical protein